MACAERCIPKAWVPQSVFCNVFSPEFRLFTDKFLHQRDAVPVVGNHHFNTVLAKKLFISAKCGVFPHNTRGMPN
ncbi:MAG: hypothetical protein CM15mP115_01980 [Alphaproteobacteria bacterium]|nr:MAG: hypothetical protein CM15mP115_01980 [Alphaproteobacteria bacterium]